MDDQALLTTVALNAADRNIRRAAFNRITGQDALAKIAREGNDAEICAQAVQRLDDQALLTSVALSDAAPDIRVKAANRCQDQATMLEVYACVAQQSDSDLAGIEALKCLQDHQAAIYSTAQPAVHENVRLQAVSMLEDTTFLVNVALHSRCGMTAMRALELLASHPDDVQEAIKKIVFWGQRDEVCIAAVSKLHDITTLVQIAKESTSQDVRERAVMQLYCQSGLGQVDLRGIENKNVIDLYNKIQNNPVLKEIDKAILDEASNLPHGSHFAIELGILLLVLHPRVPEKMKRSFIDHTTNADALILMVKYAQERGIRQTALRKTTNDQQLVKIAESNARWKDRYQAAIRVEDNIIKQSLLKNLALCAPNERQFSNAVENISDPTLLAEVARQVEFPNVVNGLVGKIALDKDRGQALLFNCVVEAVKMNTRTAAVERMTDKNLLMKIAKNRQQPYYLRKRAAKKLQDTKLIKSLDEEEAQAVAVAAQKRQLVGDNRTQMKFTPDHGGFDWSCTEQ